MWEGDGRRLNVCNLGISNIPEALGLQDLQALFCAAEVDTGWLLRVIPGKETACCCVFPDWRPSEILRNPHLTLSLVR